MSCRTLSLLLLKKLLLIIFFAFLLGGSSGSLYAQGAAPVTVTISSPTLDWPDFSSVIEVPILLSNIDPDLDIHLFNLYIKYNPEDLAFFGAEMGPALIENDWEIFRYSFYEYGNFFILGSTEDWNEPQYQTATPLGNSINDTLAILRFFVFRLSEEECPDYDINFYWTGCYDNILGDSTFWINQHLSNSVFDFEGNEITAQDTFPTIYGAHDSCLDDSNDFYMPTRAVDFHNGQIQFECPDWVDHRGDVNWNGLPLEIADFVLFQNYLLLSDSVFTINYEAQLFATDVNSDGIWGSLNDFVFMWLVISGDLPLYGDPPIDVDTALFIQDLSGQTVSMQASDSPAAVYLVFDGNITPIDTMVESSRITYHQQNDSTRVLIYTPGTISDNFVFGDGVLFHYTGVGFLVRGDASNNGLSYYINDFEIVNSDYICGDVNADGEINISDPLFLLNYIFLAGYAPIPLEAGDVTCDGVVNISDVIYIINYVFRGGNPPCDSDGDGELDC